MQYYKKKFNLIQQYDMMSKMFIPWLVKYLELNININFWIYVMCIIKTIILNYWD